MHGDAGTPKLIAHHRVVIVPACFWVTGGLDQNPGHRPPPRWLYLGQHERHHIGRIAVRVPLPAILDCREMLLDVSFID
jgi:hypothetical protein